MVAGHLSNIGDTASVFFLLKVSAHNKGLVADFAAEVIQLEIGMEVCHLCRHKVVDIGYHVVSAA